MSIFRGISRIYKGGFSVLNPGSFLTLNVAMKSRFLILISLLTALALPVSAEDVHTPSPGSPERKAIMDGMRDWVMRQHQIEAIFVINALLVKDGYAWVNVNPQSPDGSAQYEPLSGVLKLEGGSWKMVFPDPAVELSISGNLSESAAREKANALLLQQVPGIPRELVPR